MSNEKLVWIRFTKIWSERAFSIRRKEVLMEEKEKIIEIEIESLEILRNILSGER